MALTLTATAGSASANSYATVAEAEAVAEYRIGGAAFIALTDDQQIQALVTATRDIDSIANAAPGVYAGFIGEKATEAQALEWPRTGTDYDSLPSLLVTATIELAISFSAAAVAGTNVLNPVSGLGTIKRKKTDVLETEYFENTAPAPDVLSRFPLVVQNLLRSLVIVAAEHTWGAGTASRGS